MPSRKPTLSAWRRMVHEALQRPDIPPPLCAANDREPNQQAGPSPPAVPPPAPAPALVEAVARLLAERQAPLSPLLALRIRELLYDAVLADGVETALWHEGLLGDAGSKGKFVHPGVDALGKARDRMRKALGELEELLDRLGAPSERGFVDHMKPLLEKARGAVDEAMDDAEAADDAS